jgi:predicted regulator of Ras-like GTPase activity (Roadblock/LC7/MglB family)
MAQILHEKDSVRLRKVLVQLLARSESDDCLLCDSGGHVLALEGASKHDPFLISALGAGIFGASRELARMLGENEFSAVLHQGEHRSIFLRAVDADTLLVMIFSRSANVGLVKLYSTPAVDDLRQILADIQHGPSVPGPEDSRPFVLSPDAQLFSLRKE